MNPNGVTLRESRDSEEHPNSVPIIVGLDLTGSMGSIPLHLVKETFPTMMDKIIKAGIPDPQVLFLGIGDHEEDSAPLQVGQFESSDALLDHWLTKLWIESGGGGNGGESYLLAWYFGGRFTKHDAMEKRNKKGYLFTIGDEPNLPNLPGKAMNNLMGSKSNKDATATELLDEASALYNCHHLHIAQGHHGNRKEVQDTWKQNMGKNMHIIGDSSKVAEVMANIIVKGENASSSEEAAPAAANGPKLSLGGKR
jgi:hypothetical protein